MSVRHVDRYAHLRPGAGDRSHYKADGSPKRSLGQAQAEGAAVALTERMGAPVNAYECPVCGAWHTGRARQVSA